MISPKIRGCSANKNKNQRGRRNCSNFRGVADFPGLAGVTEKQLGAICFNRVEVRTDQKSDKHPPSGTIEEGCETDVCTLESYGHLVASAVCTLTAFEYGAQPMVRDPRGK